MIRVILSTKKLGDDYFSISQEIISVSDFAAAEQAPD